MAGSLAALLGAVSAWLALALVFAGVGLGLAMTWRTWGSRLPGTERVLALFQRTASLDAADTPLDADNDGSEADASEWLDEAEPTPAMLTPVPAPAPPVAAPVAPAAAAAPRPTPSGWLEPFRAAGWDVVDEGTADAVDPPPVSIPWSGGIDRDSATAHRAASVRRGGALGPLVPTRTTVPIGQPGAGQGHPNDAALDAFGDPQVDPARGTRVIPIGPPNTTLGPDTELVEIDVDAPWTVDPPEGARPTTTAQGDPFAGSLPDEGAADAASGQVGHTVEDPFAARLSGEGAADNPFAARPDGPQDDVDRLLAGALSPAPAGPTRTDPPALSLPVAVDAVPAPQPGTTPAHATGRNVVPVGPPPAPATEVPALPPQDASPVPLVPTAPRERTLSRTEAIEELTAIYTISYEDACALLDVGLWGFENHEEWIRAVRGGGRPEGISEEVFQKILAMPMRAIQGDLEKLRAKRKATQELEKMWGVGAPEASALYDAGFTTLVEIREASVDQLARVPGINHSTAFMIKAAAHGLAPDAH